MKKLKVLTQFSSNVGAAPAIVIVVGEILNGEPTSAELYRISVAQYESKRIIIDKLHKDGEYRTYADSAQAFDEIGGELKTAIITIINTKIGKDIFVDFGNFKDSDELTFFEEDITDFYKK